MANSLLKQVKQLPIPKSVGRCSWTSRITAKQKLEIDELIDLWIDNQLRDKFPSLTNIARFIAAQPFVPVTWQSIRLYILERADGKTR